MDDPSIFGDGVIEDACDPGQADVVDPGVAGAITLRASGRGAVMERWAEISEMPLPLDRLDDPLEPAQVLVR